MGTVPFVLAVTSLLYHSREGARCTAARTHDNRDAALIGLAALATPFSPARRSL
jgi:hypothetical protein